MKFPKRDETQLSRYFKAREFDCPCQHCPETVIDSQLISQLEVMRERSGLPIHVTSGYRCEWYQADLKRRGYETAVGISQHQLGRAADIVMGGITGEEIERHARMAGFHAVGVGSAWCHVDLRSDRERRWTYKS